MLDFLNSRRSTRNFLPDEVDEQVVFDILEVAMNAPSAMNEQTWHFIVLKGEMLKSFLEINSNSPKGAPLGILVCMDLGNEKLKGFAVQDCSAATQNILLAVHALKLGAVWTTVFEENKESVKKLLEIPPGFEPFSFVPIGHPEKEKEAPISRYDASRIHLNRW